jgi:hypothetical protein
MNVRIIMKMSDKITNKVYQEINLVSKTTAIKELQALVKKEILITEKDWFIGCRNIIHYKIGQ